MKPGFWRWSIRATGDMQDEIRRLGAAVDRLILAQQKNAGQIKKLREAVHASREAASRSADRAELLAAELRRMREDLRETAHRRDKTLDRIDAGLKLDAKWRAIFAGQLSALIRRLCLPMSQLPPSYALNALRFRLRSQNEEDGILLALLDRAGWGGRRFVEIGSGGSGGNAAVLAGDCGWDGLMIEASPRGAARARARFACNPGVTVLTASVTPDNVGALLAEHGYDSQVDLLSIDIDSYDYWILEALPVSPRVLILEYNALFGPTRRVTVPLGQALESAPKGYSGASLPALAALAERRGYRLVACEDAGVNAFFLRQDVATDIEALSVEQAFKPLRRADDDEPQIDIYETVDRLGLPLVEV